MDHADRWRSRRRAPVPIRRRRRRRRSDGHAGVETQINLTWTASTDNVAVTGYRIERCQGAGCSSFAEIAAPAGTATQFSDAGLTRRARSTRYRVRAMDAAHECQRLLEYRRHRNDRSRHGAAISAWDADRDGDQRHADQRSWGAATDNVGVIGYRLERCQGVGCTASPNLDRPSPARASTTSA